MGMGREGKIEGGSCVWRGRCDDWEEGEEIF